MRAASLPPLSLYDSFFYPSALYPQTHPDRLATLATLFGLAPTPPHHCRVLELGCGDGTNLLSMAYALPNSQFLGLDLAALPLGRGNSLISRLQLSNVQLLSMDLANMPANLGHFDYIIAHGLYSWVPDTIRQKIWELCQQRLAPHGIVYISYNAYPGNTFRDLVRGMMQFHTRQFPDPRDQVQQARGFLQFLAKSKPEPEIYQQVLESELKRVLNYADPAFFHDDLSPHQQPFFFHEFMAQATQHGLRFLAEADPLDYTQTFPASVRDTLGPLEEADPVVREQYLDFLKCRSFRQTLLCAQDHVLSRTPQPNAVQQLYVAGDLRHAAEGQGTDEFSPLVFYGPKGAEIETARPAIKSAFLHLESIWPGRVSFENLVSHTRTVLFCKPKVDLQMIEQELAAAVLQSYFSGFIDLHATPAAFVTHPGERPTASALARAFLEVGSILPTLRHTAVKIENSLDQNLLRLLDGSRTRPQLALALSLSQPPAPSDPPPSHPRSPEGILDELEPNLKSLARLGLLVA